VLAGSALFVSGFALGSLQQTTAGTPESRQELFRPFWDAYNDITLNYVGEIDEKALVEGAIKGVFEALGDPFSGYMTADEFRGSLTGLSGEFEGIGAELATVDDAGAACQTIGDGCRMTVMRVLRRSPALAAGLAAGDVILAVDGEPTAGSDLAAVIERIRGPKGTAVALTVGRAGDQLELAIVRDVIQAEHVRSEVLADGAVGYLKVDNFSSGAADDLHEQLRVLVEDNGVRALVLDLRDDPGGYVDKAVQIASEFVAADPLYYEQSARGEPRGIEPVAGGVATDPARPMVVLVNGGTASASEIVAAVLQGHGRALLVGEKTYGKGTVQEWKELAGAGGYRLSVRKWLTPDKTWIHGVGLLPDVVVTPPADQPAGEDAVLDRALELLLDELAGGTGRRLVDVLVRAA
jgi:carboxyl-terminal processing protease